MTACQYHGETSTENYVKDKNKEDDEKNIVILTVDIVIDEGTSHGLERDSKFHCHGGVGEDNGVHITVDLDVIDDREC